MLFPVRAKNFYYKVGNVQTTVPWFKPDPQYMNNWKEEFFSHPEVPQFRYFLHGASLQNANTYDIDIMMSNKFNDPKELERVFEIAIDTGFKNRQYIDLKWVNIPGDRILKQSPCHHFELACNNYIENGYCTVESCSKTNPHHTYKDLLRYGRTIIKNDKTLFSYLNDKRYLTPKESIFAGTELVYREAQGCGGLPKIIKKMKNKFYTMSIVEINKDTNFMDLIKWA